MENDQKNGSETNGAAGIEGTTAAAPATELSPEVKIAELEAMVASLKDQTLRALAELENTRRRAQREREDTAKFAVASFAKDLVAVADNLRRALDAVPAEAREADGFLQTLAVGVEATERQLLSAFERVGIKKLEPLDDVFDPNFHQVMFELEGTGRPSGTVVQVLQSGYTINGRLLREAMVGVAKRGADEPIAHIDTKA
ncbi:Protein GrpE [uncultured Gammaproteobacteria bacterium]